MSESLFSLPPSRHRIIFLALLADTLLLSLIMGWAGQPLATPAAPNGIVSFELAGSAAASQAILDSWDARSQVHAAFIQGLDFLYLLVYAATFSLAGLYAAQVLQRLGWPLARLGKPLVIGFGFAAFFDLIENIALLVILFDAARSPWPEIAAVFAWLKFGLLFLGLVYIFYGAALFLADRLLPPARKPAE